MAQRSVADAVADERKIVDYKYSTLVYFCREEVQVQLNQPKRRLATYYMLQSLFEQKQALGIVGSEYELLDNLTAHQRTLLEKTICSGFV